MPELTNYLTTKEAENFCCCSRATLERMRKFGILHPVRPNIGKNSRVLYRKDELLAWLNGELTMEVAR